MKLTLSALVLSAAVPLLACGGPTPKSADDAVGQAPPTSATEDMPPPPAAPANATANATGPSTAAPAEGAPAADAKPATTTLKVVALKLTVDAKAVKTKGFSTIEVKDDGTVLKDGKPAGKFVGTELQDNAGKTLATVGADGAVTGLPKAMKFSSSDDLTMESGAKIAIADDGTIAMVNDKGVGESAPMKFDSVPAWAKREASLVVAGLVMGSKGGGAAPSANAKKKK